MNGEIQKIKISALPEALTVSDSDCFLIVQNRKAKRVKPSLMKGKKGDQGLSAYLGVTATHIVWKLGIDGVWQSLISIASLIGPRGEKPIFKKVNGSLMMKYEGEPDSALVNIFDREELKLKFTDLTPAQVDQLKLHFSDLSPADIAVLQNPATDAAKTVTDKMAQIVTDSNTVILNTNAAKDLAIEVANNPTRIDENCTVEIYDPVTNVYNKTTINVKGKAFTYADFTPEQLEILKGVNIYKDYISLPAMMVVDCVTEAVIGSSPVAHVKIFPETANKSIVFQPGKGGCFATPDGAIPSPALAGEIVMYAISTQQSNVWKEIKIRFRDPVARTTEAGAARTTEAGVAIEC